MKNLSPFYYLCIAFLAFADYADAAVPEYDCTTKNDKEYCKGADKKPVTGKITKYQDDGNYLSIINYKNGYQDGLATYFGKNGKLKERAYFKQGVKNGMDKVYYENRTIYQLLNYRRGLLNGVQVYYTSKGKQLGRFEYKDGVLQSGFCMRFEGEKFKKYDLSHEEIKQTPQNQLVKCEEP